MSAVKALQQWCKIQVQGYRDVTITNMTTSFRDGMAFCALIHRNRPDLIDFDSLKKENVYDNNHLAFRVAEDELGIPALLDAEDMVALKIPDRLSILTYVSQYYNYFHGKSPIGGMAGIKRPAEASTEEGPSGKKNQAVVSKVFPASPPSKSATENRPPPSSSPKASTRPDRAAQKDVLSERSNKTGTLSSKCSVCNKHVHLVQRHLVDGRLYHRSCARCSECSTTLLSGNCKPGPTPGSFICTSHHHPQGALPTHTPLRDLAKNNPTTPAASKYTPHPPPTVKTTPLSDLSKNNPGPKYTDPSKSTPAPTPTSTPSKFGPSWLSSKTTTPSAASSRPSPGLSSPGIVSPAASGPTTVPRSFNTTTSATTPTASKTQQARLQFFQSGNTPTGQENQGKTQTQGQAQSLPTNRVPNAGSQGTVVGVGQGVSMGGVGGKGGGSGWGRDVVVGGDRDVVQGRGSVVFKMDSDVKASPSKEDCSTKTQAAAVITKKLTESNNTTAGASSPPWPPVGLKKTENRPIPAETPKKETETPKKETGGRVKLKADPSLLVPLTPNTSTPTPASRTGLWNKPLDKAPGAASPSNTMATADNSSSPADWRSRLKPASKPVGPKDSSPLHPDIQKAETLSRPRAGGSGNLQASVPAGSTLAPSSPPEASSPSPLNTGPGTRGVLTGKSSTTANGPNTDTNTPKPGKPDYIPKEEILRELQEIEDSVNELERKGVDLEKQLRSCEEEGEEDVVMDDLMVEWFNLIRNKQVSMRRESELVYIAKTQDLEEQQPSVEQELRRLMDKPERLKTSWDRRREEELMVKLVEIVNDRNAIIEGLDDDRLREDEEDEQLSKMMKNLGQSLHNTSRISLPSITLIKPKVSPYTTGLGSVSLQLPLSEPAGEKTELLSVYSLTF
ncbi:MICAL-like protein 2 isoform X3 [Salmo salar]|uniref:MICAL-like protein 2 isoform X3 n=1 Tax=Salmo salar TaxID=8030 RepID=A0ABM3E665_SALSA|nr:MICAL-like protein 2 isoform X3 [Salmo salar]